MPTTNNRIPKLKVEVELVLSDGRTLHGQVFLLPSQRVIDLLNGPEPFFPFREGASGKITLCNKSAVSTLRPLD